MIIRNTDIYVYIKETGNGPKLILTDKSTRESQVFVDIIEVVVDVKEIPVVHKEVK